MSFGWAEVANIASKVVDKGVGAWLQSRERRAQQDWQEEMQNTAIERRVADANRAGVHPLFALGASLTSPQPIGVGSMEDAGIFGPAVSSAVKREMTADQRAALDLTQKEIQSRIDLNEAHAQYYRSAAAGRAGGNPAPSVVGGNFMEGASVPYKVVDMPEAVQLDYQDANYPGRFSVVKPTGAQIMSADPDNRYLAAGPAGPGSQRYHLTKNMEVLLPAAQNLGEALEPLSESLLMMYTWYRINVNHYGEQFADLAFQELGLPQTALRALKGISGWSDWASMKGPSVRYTGPGNPLLPRIPRMIHERR